MSSYRLIVYQLTRPISYLFIKHTDKYIYDWVVPFILLLIFSLGVFFLPVGILELYALVEKMSGFFSALPGFFIAALAAIATFNRLDIDRPMSGKNPPKVETLINTQYLDVELTRRRFLCMLFSFLTMESIGLSLFGFIPQSFDFYDMDKSSMNLDFSWSVIYLFVYFFFSFQVLTITMHGMYYLGDRIHYQ